MTSTKRFFARRELSRALFDGVDNGILQESRNVDIPDRFGRHGKVLSSILSGSPRFSHDCTFLPWKPSVWTRRRHGERYVLCLVRSAIHVLLLTVKRTNLIS